jgi:hypothetical protein
MGTIYKDYTDKLWQTLIWTTIRLRNWQTNWMNTPSDMHLHS